MTLPRQKKGGVIRASFLNDIAGGVDDLTREFASRPSQVDEAAPAAVQNQAAEDDDVITSPTLYIESSRTVSTVQVFDQNDENYAEIDRINRISFSNSAGETITLEFNNT